MGGPNTLYNQNLYIKLKKTKVLGGPWPPHAPPKSVIESALDAIGVREVVLKLYKDRTRI